MAFDPQLGAMKCPYCGTTKTIPKEGLASVVEHPFHEHLDDSTWRKISATALEITCTGCGASVQFEPPQVAGECSFCGAKLVAQPKAADPLLAPDGVLPFALPNPQATQMVKGWLSSRWFAPNALKSIAKPEGIHGVYVPFWTFDAKTSTVYEGECGRDRIIERRQGNQIVREVVTDWFPASGQVDLNFDDVLVPATKSISTDRLQQLEPWDLDKVNPYEPAFLSGFQAQRYQVDAAQGLDLAKGQMESQIQRAIYQDIGGDRQRIQNKSTTYDGVSFKHLLLPVWIGAYKFQGRVFQVSVNARTGEVQGERPYSTAKIIALIIVLLFFFWILSRSQS